jgi:hypothetical protein
MARDYTYDKAYAARPEQKKARASRNRARRLMIKKYGKSKLKGKDVDHKNGNPRSNRLSNLQITSVHYNRAKH